MNRSIKRSLVMFAVLSFWALPAAAQSCLRDLPPPLYDSSDDCANTPYLDRALAVDGLLWNGIRYLVVNMGNELELWDVEVPHAPVRVDSTRFNVRNQGDSDYDLLTFTVCDDCRFGAANFKTGTVLFDLGTGARPNLRGPFEFYEGAVGTRGAFSFAHEGQQYLIASELPDGCPHVDSTLFDFNGIEGAGLEAMQCLMADGTPARIMGGFELASGDDNYLYLGDTSQDLLIFKVDDSGGPVVLDFVSSPMKAVIGRGKGIAIDQRATVMVNAELDGASLWSVADPTGPRLLATIPGEFDLAAIRSPLLWIARRGIDDSSRTYDITNPSIPRRIASAFWDGSRPWNSYDCQRPYDSEFSADGSALYLTGFSILQAVDSSACPPPWSASPAGVEPLPD